MVWKPKVEPLTYETKAEMGTRLTRGNERVNNDDGQTKEREAQ